MKLSDIKGERCLDVIAEIIDPIANIAQDEETLAVFRKEKLRDGETIRQFGVRRAKTAIPVLLKRHKKDLIAIMAAIEGVTSEEYAESLNLAKLMKDTSDLMSDKAFASLFTSAQTENGSGSAQANLQETP